MKSEWERERHTERKKGIQREREGDRQSYNETKDEERKGEMEQSSQKEYGQKAHRKLEMVTNDNVIGHKGYGR